MAQFADSINRIFYHLVGGRRIIFWIIVAISSLWMAQRMTSVLEGVDIVWLRAPIFILFVSCFTWICVPFWIAMAGIILLLFRKNPLDFEWKIPLADPAPILTDRIAVVMPAYNESAAMICAALATLYDEIEQLENGSHFDFFILSDTRSERLASLEATLCAQLREEGRTRIYYRRREQNIGRKAGNIEDFVKRWGAHYESMVILDADSIMTGESVHTLARYMNANPSAGIIQTSPQVVFADSFFARLIQFTSRLYGPLFSLGTAFWYGADGNYWGHNAIIRIEAFRQHCGLGDLPGAPPFGGSILSHDFVEAALLRAAGYGVYLLPNLPGSYEQVPPTPLDFLLRDKRWSQGNLQHLKLLFRPHLTLTSKTFFVLGALAYVSSPLWLLLLIFSTLANILEALLPHQYYTHAYQLFPQWPISRESDAIALFFITAAILFIPKIGGLLLVLSDKNARQSFGGGVALTLSVLCESIFFIFFSPTMMMFHSYFVVTTLLGSVAQWNPQNRGSGRIRLRSAFRSAGWISIIAVVWILLIALISPGQLFWMGPVLGGLLASPFLISWASSVGLGIKARNFLLFITPDEHKPSATLETVQKNRLRLETIIDAMAEEIDPGIDSFIPNESIQSMGINPVFQVSKRRSA